MSTGAESSHDPDSPLREETSIDRTGELLNRESMNREFLNRESMTLRDRLSRLLANEETSHARIRRGRLFR